MDLSPSSGVILIQFLSRCRYTRVKTPKRTHYPIANNGDIVFTYEDAHDLGHSSSTFRNAVRDLETHGFIRQTVRGLGGRGAGEQRPSRFEISEGWKAWTDGTE